MLKTLVTFLKIKVGLIVVQESRDPTEEDEEEGRRCAAFRLGLPEGASREEIREEMFRRAEKGLKALPSWDELGR